MKPTDNKVFKVKLPVIMLPDNFGGKPAIVFALKGNVKDPTTMFGVCIDIDGRTHKDVPFPQNAVQIAMANMVTFLAVPDLDGPSAGLFGPGGQPIG